MSIFSAVKHKCLTQFYGEQTRGEDTQPLGIARGNMLTPHPSFLSEICPKTGILLVWSDTEEGSATPGCRSLPFCTHHKGLLSSLPTSGGVPQLLESSSLSQGDKVAPDALSCVCLQDLLGKVRNTSEPGKVLLCAASRPSWTSSI